MIFEVLRELNKPGVKSMRNIEDKLDVSTSMLDIILDDLEKRGYIEKIEIAGVKCTKCTNVCPFIGRNSCSISTWEITEKGKKVVNSYMSIDSQHLSPMVGKENLDG
jgi:hypothetical protein